MKTFLKWIGAALIMLGAVIGALFMLQRRSQPFRQPSADSSRSPVPRNELDELGKGLARIRNAAIHSGGTEARKDFISEFSTLLEQERKRLRAEEQADDGLLDKYGKPRDDDELMYFASARRICRRWAESSNTPSTLDAFVIGSLEGSDFRTIEGDVARAAREGRLGGLHGRARTVLEALSMFKEGDWPFKSVAGANVVYGALAGQIADIAREQKVVKAPQSVRSWLPLLQVNECQALVVRKVFERNGEIDESIVDGKGIPAESLIEARTAIEKERTAILAAVNNPESKLLPEFEGEEGKSRARESINRQYDAVRRFFDSYSEDWPPPGESAARSAEPIITPVTPESPRKGTGQGR